MNTLFGRKAFKYNGLTIMLCLSFALLLTACKKPAQEPPVEDLLYYPPVGSSSWETIRPENLGWNTSHTDELLSLLERSGSRAFLVLIDGRIVMEHYFGKNATGTAPFGANTNWYWASAGKTLTAWMTGKASEQGHLHLDDPTARYLGTGWTSLSNEQEQAITIRHQLSMTTGLDETAGNGDDTSAASLQFKAVPGTRWAYHNAPYTLLERVVSKATGLSFHQYFNSELRDLIGMDGFWLWSGNNHVYYSTARSMARFGLLVLRNGTWEGKQLLAPTGFIQQMKNSSQNLNPSYGFLWWLNGKNSYMLPILRNVFQGDLMPEAPKDMFCALGKNGQILQIIPSRKMIVIRMGENADQRPVSADIGNEIWTILQKIVP
jgi:CubicO group peptidase (beta-lactamase class C family)